ncbi:MAG: hypothetical protein ACR2KQ_02335 [Actinomycetota bacterium]
MTCRQCGEDADLTGRRTGGTIEIRCNRCDHSWIRDVDPACPTCGGGDLRPFKEPLIQRARGNAYSIVGERLVHLCEVCDADEIARRAPAEQVGQAPREDPWK